MVDRLIYTVDPTETTIIGNDETNTQYLLSNTDSKTKATDMAKANGLAVVSFDDCLDSIKQFYRINGDVLIVKTETKKTEKEKTNDNGKTTHVTKSTVNIDYYDPQTRKKLDKSQCKKQMTEIKLKVAVTVGEKTKAAKMRQSGVDIFNPQDPTFTSNCVTFVDPDTGNDTTMDWRQKNYFVSKPDCASNGCTYKGLGEDDYMLCDCSNEDNNIATGYSNNLLTCSGDITVKFC
jgi:hypothetical protein